MDPDKSYLIIYCFLKTIWLRINRNSYVRSNILIGQKIKINYGCGNNRQEGYINVDIRYTPSVDLLADLNWCAKNLQGRCDEVYLSHVLEHFRYPGKKKDTEQDTVIGALICVEKMLSKEGVIRIAVPDFRSIAELYLADKKPLFPKLSGRLCGEQNYPQNLHRCVFDREFLTMCLHSAGFTQVEEWDPHQLGLSHDSSFDQIDDVCTSLNLCARKE